MDAHAIDHVNLRIPENSSRQALDFYVDRLGFEAEGLDAYDSGEKPFFSIRLAPDCVLHLWPTDEFDSPTGTSFDHVAITVDDSIDEVKRTLERAELEIENELDSPRGATGTAPAVYVRDPFGYRVELKQA